MLWRLPEYWMPLPAIVSTGRPRARRDDASRDRRLNAAGYTVLRFTDKDVYEHPAAVKARTLAALASLRERAA